MHYLRLRIPHKRIQPVGFSDWLDGYVAKRFAQESVLGSYLDPLADKAVIVCTVGALGWVEALSPGMVALLVGRDALMVLGAFARRCGSLVPLFLCVGHSDEAGSCSASLHGWIWHHMSFSIGYD